MNLEQLRRAFDAGFEEEPAAVGEAPEAVLWVRTGGRLVGLPLRDLLGLDADVPVVALPDAPAGIAGVEGRLVACHSLARALDLAPRGPERWLALVRAEEGLAFTFEELDGLRPVAREAMRLDPGGTAYTVEHEGAPAPILRLGALVERLRAMMEEEG